MVQWGRSIRPAATILLFNTKKLKTMAKKEFLADLLIEINGYLGSDLVLDYAACYGGWVLRDPHNRSKFAWLATMGDRRYSTKEMFIYLKGILQGIYATRQLNTI